MQLYEKGDGSHMRGQMEVQEAGEVDPTNIYLFVQNFITKGCPWLEYFKQPMLVALTCPQKSSELSKAAIYTYPEWLH
jgi:hypothetical protein